MRASVIIPCRNAERTVADAVASALAQSQRPLEVLVVDDASADASAEVARKAGARVLVNATRRNAGGARNAGIDATSGELLAFLDADAVAAPDWLARARRLLEADPTVAGVGARIVNGRPGRYGELDYFLNHSEWIGGSRPARKANIPTMAIVYRRDAVGAIRFPESNSGEDTAFALAVAARGGRLLYDPQIRVTHRHERLDHGAFWEKQLACGKTIYRTRTALDRPGKILVQAPALLFLFPHLWITLARMARAGYLGKAVRLFPWLLAGEIARIQGFFQARRELRDAAGPGQSQGEAEIAEKAAREARA